MQLLTFIVTFFLPSLATLALFTKYYPEQSKKITIPLSFIVGPFTLILLFYFQLLLLPELPRYWYVFSCTGGMCTLLYFSGLKNIKIQKKDLIIFDSQQGWLNYLLLFLILLVISLLVFFSIEMPLFGNDPTEYIKIAQIIFRDITLANYPLRVADPLTGLFAPSMHPPFYHCLIAWTFFCQNSSDIHIITKICALYFAIVSAWAVISFVFEFHNRSTAYIASIFFLTTPLYFSLVIQCHTDAPRISMLLISLVWLNQVIQNNRVSYWISCGCLIGLSLFSHSIGILTLLLCIGIFFLLKIRELRFQIFRPIFIIVLSAICIGGWQYLINYYEVGNLISDRVSVWEMDSLNFSYYLNMTRGLFDFQDMLKFGVFKGFFKPNSFGISYLIFFLLPFAFILQKKSKLRDKSSTTSFQICLIVLVTFLSACLITGLLGISLMIKNDRYLMTIQPLVAILGALLLTYFHKSIKIFFVLLSLAPIVLYVLILTIKYHNAFGIESEFEKVKLSNMQPFYSFTQHGQMKNGVPSLTLINGFQSFVFYSNTKSINAIDPRMISLYTIKDKDDALNWLKKKNISSIFLPYYKEPMFTKTILKEIISSPEIVEFSDLLNTNGTFLEIRPSYANIQRILVDKFYKKDITKRDPRKDQYFEVIDRSKTKNILIYYSKRLFSSVKWISNFLKFHLIDFEAGYWSISRQKPFKLNSEKNYLISFKIEGKGLYTINSIEKILRGQKKNILWKSVEDNSSNEFSFFYRPINTKYNEQVFEFVSENCTLDWFQIEEIVSLEE